MVELKITGFGFTWLDGDYPLAAIIGSFVAILLSFAFALRLIGSRMHIEYDGSCEGESAAGSSS